MLKEISLMAQIVSAVKEAIPQIELSVKLRSGFESAGEMEKIIPALKEAGTDKFFFHYRTVRELYAAGIADREERFRKVMELAGDTPVVLNGDFGGSKESLLAEMERFQCAGLMLGRKFLSDPGVLRRLNGETDETKEEFCRALIRNGLGGEALKGMKRWIFGSWNYELPPQENPHGK
jgi:tRNA-dihydrouridine synthase